jgi:hypothetical protein
MKGEKSRRYMRETWRYVGGTIMGVTYERKQTTENTK